MTPSPSPYADTSPMFLVHDIFRRELGLLPDLIADVPPGGQRAADVASHVALMCSLLHHHHLAEDDVLWPLLLTRAPREIDPVVHLSQGQHEAIDSLVGAAGKQLEGWREGASAVGSAALSLTLRQLAVTAFEHMALEERLVLPLVERHVFAAEWEEMERASLATMGPEEAVLVAGMMLYEAGPEAMPAAFPPELLEAGPKAFAAHSQRVHGTPAPSRSTELAIGTPLVGLASEVA